MYCADFKAIGITCHFNEGKLLLLKEVLQKPNNVSLKNMQIAYWWHQQICLCMLSIRVGWSRRLEAFEFENAFICNSFLLSGSNRRVN